METETGTARIQSVDRAIDLLLAVAAGPPAEATAPALARRCGINRATAWRLLKTLQARGLVTLDESTQRYAVGMTAVELGAAAGPDSLVAVAHPELERICRETGETASLAVPGIGGLTYVDEVRPHAVLAASWLGVSVPAHATSTGKALLAFLPTDQTRRLIGGTLTAYTSTTITDPDALVAELAATRARGYGTCAGELEASLYGVSAPVLDRAGRPLAVLSIWGPQDRVRVELFPELGALAVAGAARISASATARHRSA
ncbi:IclR family transcriptional regulator [Pseudonocardia sp. CA-107938]|uniref:IclR family transcriptional regulator n=1 Tax=Pseudonocardia sp. CA-107938 TaxID=3240021 RepID=UPI003D8F24AA